MLAIQTKDDPRLPWTIEGASVIPEGWSGSTYTSDLSGNRAFIRSVTLEAAREDYGISGPLPDWVTWCWQQWGSR